MWHGALTPRKEKGVSLRKEPLGWFMYTKRLRTLVVHISESAKERMRRPYEMLDPSDYKEDFVDNDEEEDEENMNIFGLEVRRTDFQPNYRKYRSMRTVQGMDFIYELRGMRWVRFNDTKAGCVIRDWSFIQDINNVVTRRKTESATLKAEIDNLRPLTGLQDFSPDDETRELVAHFYDDTPVEDVSVGGLETSSSDSTGISGASTAPSDSFDSDPDDGPGGFSRSRSGSSTSDTNRSMEITDDDTRMDEDDDEFGPNNNEQQPSDIDMSDVASDIARLSHSSSDGGGDNPDDSGLSIASAIVIDDDDNDTISGRTHGDYQSTDSGLFVRSGSGTAPDSDRSDGDTNTNVFNGISDGFIDLTLEDGEDEENDVQGEKQVIKIDDDDDDDKTNIKEEKSPSQSSPGPSGSGLGGSAKRSLGEGSLD